MANAKDLLRKKNSQEVVSVSPDAMLIDAMVVMAEHNIGAVLVKDTSGVVGILSERDVLREGDVAGRNCRETAVREIMTKRVLYVSADQELDECMALMTDKNIRHLPVYEGDTLLGLISVRDVMREMLSEKQFMVSQLEKYIRGGA